MRIEAIAIDLDGTLLNSEHKISDYNKKVIKKLKESGIEIIIATGRLYKSLYKYKEELELDTPVICYNGAMVVDGKTNEIIFEVNLQKSIVKKLIEIARQNDIHLNLFEGDKWYVEANRKEVDTYRNTSGLNYHMIDFNDIDKINVNKAMFVGENLELLKIEKILEETFEDGVYKAFSKPYFLEVLDKNVSKGRSLLETLKKYEIDKERVIAFGDGYNDIEMLEGVGIGVAMGNSPDGVKEKFSNVADTNDNNGVGKWLAEFFKLEI